MGTTAQGSGYIPLCRASALLPFISFSERIGTPVGRRLSECRLPYQALESPEALFPLASGFRFAAGLAQSEGLKDLGFIVGIDTRFQDLGAFGRLVLGSVTLHDALCKVSSIIHLFNSAQYIWLERHGATTLICTTYRPRLDDGWKFGEQYTLTLLINCIRAATGKTWLPSEIHLEATLFDFLQGRADVLGVSTIKRRSASALAVDSALLAIPMDRLRRSGRGDEDADLGVLASNPPPTDFAGSVAHLSRLFMGNEQFQIDSIASVMGMSVRTLQRRLADHGVDFSSILERARFDRAVALLADPSMSIVNITLELGYSEVSSFSRAFRRWTGMPPAEFRKTRLQSG